MPSSSHFVAAALCAMVVNTLAEPIDFTPCTGNTFGLTTNVDISPCERGAPDEPCRFRYGGDYTISIEYSPLVAAEKPRASLQARDDFEQPSLRYAYSGQAFDACEYTACPVEAGSSATYTYEFHTLDSRFNHLTINATTDLDGPSFLCVGFEALYLPAVSGRRLK